MSEGRREEGEEGKKERNGRKKGKKERKEQNSDLTQGAPTIKPLRSPVVVPEGARITVKCEASGKPPLSYKWYKDGTILKKSKQVRIRAKKKNSKVQITSARLEDSGNYMCVVENDSGSSNSTSTVHVQSSWLKLSLDRKTERELEAMVNEDKQPPSWCFPQRQSGLMAALEKWSVLGIIA
ncbi:neuregulin 2a isoform X5 [Tachysurus ichikawai]